MFDKKKSIKKAGIIIIAAVVLFFIIGGIKIKSVSEYQAQKEALASEQQKLGDGRTAATLESSNSKDEIQEGNVGQAPTLDNESVTGTDGETSGIDVTKESDNNTQSMATLAGNVVTTTEDAAAGTDGASPDMGVANVQLDNGKSGDTQKQNETSATQGSYVTCTIEIRCDAATAKKSGISNPGVRESIPDDGTILEKTTYVAKAGATVYTVLQAVTQQKGISMHASSSVYGMYVDSIHNLKQKDVGASSGWVYYVNENWGNVAADQRVVSEGDRICWKYVTEYGD